MSNDLGRRGYSTHPLPAPARTHDHAAHSPSSDAARRTAVDATRAAHDSAESGCENPPPGCPRSGPTRSTMQTMLRIRTSLLTAAVAGAVLAPAAPAQARTDHARRRVRAHARRRLRRRRHVVALRPDRQDLLAREVRRRRRARARRGRPAHEGPVRHRPRHEPLRRHLRRLHPRRRRHLPPERRDRQRGEGRQAQLADARRARPDDHARRDRLHPPRPRLRPAAHRQHLQRLEGQPADRQAPRRSSTPSCRSRTSPTRSPAPARSATTARATSASAT